MSDKRIEELLERVAEKYRKGRMSLPDVLKRELLPLLLAGQAMRNDLQSQHGGKWPKCPQCKLQRDWDAALGGNEESDGKR